MNGTTRIETEKQSAALLPPELLHPRRHGFGVDTNGFPRANFPTKQSRTAKKRNRTKALLSPAEVFRDRENVNERRSCSLAHDRPTGPSPRLQMPARSTSTKPGR